MKSSIKTIEFKPRSKAEIYSALAALAAEFKPMIYSIKYEYWKKLSLKEGGFEDWFLENLKTYDTAQPIGDLIFSEDSILYYKFRFSNNSIEIGSISKNDREEISQFSDRLTSILQKLNFEFVDDWKNEEYSKELYDSISTISTHLNLTDRDIEGGKLLENEATRRILEKILENNGASINKIVSPDDSASAIPTIELFENQGIITKDFVVLCSKTGQPILKVPSRTVLEETPQGNNKCFICGNPLSKETIDETISCSEFGISLLKDDYWFQVRMYTILTGLGCKGEELHFWHDNKKIIYIFSIINSQPCMFVLCNKKLEIEDMYRINIYTSAYSIENLLIISTDKIPLIFKSYMEDKNKGKTYTAFIESLVSLDEAVELFLINRSHSYVVNLLNSYVATTPIDINSLVSEAFIDTSDVEESPTKESKGKNEKKKKGNKKGGDAIATEEELLTVGEQI